MGGSANELVARVQTLGGGESKAAGQNQTEGRTIAGTYHSGSKGTPVLSVWCSVVSN